jgi:nicotinamide-nucleotide amidase
MTDLAPYTAEAEALLVNFRQRGWTIATAESCTGGLISATLTEIAGSSDVFDRGFVPYSNKAKTDLLGVPAQVIASHGAVSMEVALAMAAGALRKSGTHAALAVTGIAGPGGGTPEKPVGLVHLAVAATGGTRLHIERRYDDYGRAVIRMATLRDGIQLLASLAEGP